MSLYNACEYFDYKENIMSKRAQKTIWQQEITSAALERETDSVNLDISSLAWIEVHTLNLPAFFIFKIINILHASILNSVKENQYIK